MAAYASISEPPVRGQSPQWKGKACISLANYLSTNPALGLRRALRDAFPQPTSRLSVSVTTHERSEQFSGLITAGHPDAGKAVKLQTMDGTKWSSECFCGAKSGCCHVYGLSILVVRMLFEGSDLKTRPWGADDLLSGVFSDYITMGQRELKQSLARTLKRDLNGGEILFAEALTRAFSATLARLPGAFAEAVTSMAPGPSSREPELLSRFLRLTQGDPTNLESFQTQLDRFIFSEFGARGEIFVQLGRPFNVDEVPLSHQQQAWLKYFGEIGDSKLRLPPPAPGLELYVVIDQTEARLGVGKPNLPMHSQANAEILLDQARKQPNAFVYSAGSRRLLDRFVMSSDARGLVRWPYSAEAARRTIGEMLLDSAIRTQFRRPSGQPVIFDDQPLTWTIQDNPGDAGQLVFIPVIQGANSEADDILYLPVSPAVYLSVKTGRWRLGLAAPNPSMDKLRPFPLPRSLLERREAKEIAAALNIPLPSSVGGQLKAIPLVPRITLSAGEAFEDEIMAKLEALTPDGVLAYTHYPASGWKRLLPVDQVDSPIFYDRRECDRLVKDMDWSTFLPPALLVPSDHVAGRIVDDAGITGLQKWVEGLPERSIYAERSVIGFLKGSQEGAFVFSVGATSEIDWFNCSLTLKAAEEEFTEEEITLLLKSMNGKPVRLPLKGWRKISITNPDAVPADMLKADGAPTRMHVTQLAGEDMESLLVAEAWQAARRRVDEVKAMTTPEVPVTVKAELRPYQVDGFRFLAHLSHYKLGGLLADDQGLGKTLQTLTWLAWLSIDKPNVRCLIICPKSVAFNWADEAHKFVPHLQVTPYKGEEIVPLGNLIICNYAQLRLYEAVLTKVSWDAVVLDEAQHIKNPYTSTAKAAWALKAVNRVALSGTPIENRSLDMWSIFRFAMPSLLGTQSEYQLRYKDEDPDGMELLRKRLRHFSLRRTKAQVAPELPERTEQDIVFELNPKQRVLYDAELKRVRKMLSGVTNKKEMAKKRIEILASLTRLRQICCDPRLIDKTFGDDGSVSAKVEAFMEEVESIVARGCKVLVFSPFVSMLRLLEAELDAKSIEHLSIYGETENRREVVHKFTAENYPVFLLSLAAAGSGLNLVAASYVVLFNPWWNPAKEAQAIDRTHRIGQVNPVTAYRLIAKDTVEEKILEMQEKKKKLAESIMSEEGAASVLSLEDFRQIFA